MGNVQGPEKVNYSCVKTMHVGMIDRGFTVLCAQCTVQISVNNKIQNVK